MAGKILRVSEDFWNIRGSYRIGGVIDVGTQCSLIRRANGKFVLLDSYTLSSSVKREVNALTDGGKDLEAILETNTTADLDRKWGKIFFPPAAFTEMVLRTLPQE